jgi:hypothetical protein
MKKLLLIAALLAIGSVGVYAQGSVDFRNRIVGVLDAPVFLSGGAAPVDGADFVAQLYFSATEGGTMTAVSAAPAAFRTGAGAGYWNAGASAGRTLDGIAAGDTAFLQVRVWNAAQFANFDAAVSAGTVDSWGWSDVFSVTTGGAGDPPSLPATMLDLNSFELVPEPSTCVLAALGALGLLLFRRRT